MAFGDTMMMEAMAVAEDRVKICKNFCKGYDHCEHIGNVHCEKYMALVRDQISKAAKEGVAEDVVKEPSHYQHGAFEVIDEMVIMFGMEKTIVFCQLNAWKYRARAPYKNKFEEDMAKANRYLEMAYELQQIRQEYPEADGYEVCALLKGRKKEG